MTGAGPSLLQAAPRSDGRTGAHCGAARVRTSCYESLKNSSCVMRSGAELIRKSSNNSGALPRIENYVGLRIESIDPVDKLLNQAMEDEAAHVKDDFAASSEEYFGFLCDLANLAQDLFEKGLGLSVRAIHKTRVGLMKSIMPEMFDGPHPDIDILEGSQHVRYVEFKNGVYSTVNVLSFASDNSFKCECSHRLNETYRFTLCSHLVAAIIRLGFEEHRDWKFAKHQMADSRFPTAVISHFYSRHIVLLCAAIWSRPSLGWGLKSTGIGSSQNIGYAYFGRS